MEGGPIEPYNTGGVRGEGTKRASSDLMLGLV
jgi:hypothetical protein